MANMFNTGKLPLSEKQFDKMAQHFRAVFPDDYRAFMLKNNGGVLNEPSSFHYGNDETGNIAWFYDIDSTSESDIIKANKLRDGRFPKNFVAIGFNGGGDEICIDCGPGAGFGKVYYWDHNFEADQESGETPEEAENYFLIADNFSALLDCLFEEPRSTEPVVVTDNSTDEMNEMLYQLMLRKGVPVDGFIRRKKDD